MGKEVFVFTKKDSNLTFKDWDDGTYKQKIKTGDRIYLRWKTTRDKNMACVFRYTQYAVGESGKAGIEGYIEWRNEEVASLPNTNIGAYFGVVLKTIGPKRMMVMRKLSEREILLYGT